MKNREIKFRAFHTKEKIFWYFNLVTVRTSKLIDQDWFYLEPAQQFTGLQDKNGKDIYEGDIVAWKELGYDSMSPDYDGKVEVIYDKCGFSPFTRIEKNEAFHDSHEPGDLLIDCRGKIVGYYEFEVIGNIHENPDLL